MRPQPAMIENIRLRVSVEEKAALRNAARRRGITVSEYIRDVARRAACSLPIPSPSQHSGAN